eukprot:2582941-Pyramimonas_sp.AAC.1
MWDLDRGGNRAPDHCWGTRSLLHGSIVGGKRARCKAKEKEEAAPLTMLRGRSHHCDPSTAPCG